MSDLPEGWERVRFGDLNSFSSGTVAPSNTPDEEFELYSVPVFPTGEPELQLGSAIGSTKQSVEPADVLVCKINPRINRVWQVKPKGPKRQIASSEWIVMRSPEMDPRFLRYYFTSPAFREFICQDVTGVGGSLTRAQPKRVATHGVPIAPRAEQGRIADKLDAVLARVDACRAHLDRAAEIIQRFRQSVLAAATAGDLTMDWRTNDSAPQESTTIEEIAAVGTGSTPLRSNPDFFSSDGTPWVTSAATKDQVIFAAEEFVTTAALTAHRLRVYPPGTLLVAMYGEGKTRGQVAELGIAATINQACAAIQVNAERALNGYVKLLLQANYYEMRALAVGGAQPNLNLSKIKEFRLNLPPLSEQKEIVRRVTVLFDFADSLESRLQSALTAVDALTPALLAKAFRGELVPQDPNDEPAAELLKRIRLSTEEEGAKPKRRGPQKVAPINIPRLALNPMNDVIQSLKQSQAAEARRVLDSFRQAAGITENLQQLMRPMEQVKQISELFTQLAKVNSALNSIPKAMLTLDARAIEAIQQTTREYLQAIEIQKVFAKMNFEDVDQLVMLVQQSKEGLRAKDLLPRLSHDSADPVDRADRFYQILRDAVQQGKVKVESGDLITGVN